MVRISTAEASKIIGITEFEVRTLVKFGHLPPPVMQGTRLMHRRDDIMALAPQVQRCVCVKDLAKKYGVTRATIHTWLNKAGVKRKFPLRQYGYDAVEADRKFLELQRNWLRARSKHKKKGIV